MQRKKDSDGTRDHLHKSFCMFIVFLLCLQVIEYPRTFDGDIEIIQILFIFTYLTVRDIVPNAWDWETFAQCVISMYYQTVSRVFFSGLTPFFSKSHRSLLSSQQCASIFVWNLYHLYLLANTNSVSQASCVK